MGGHNNPYLHLYLHLFLFLLPFTLFAQVTIRDTIRISTVPGPVSASTPSSTIRLVFTQSGNVDMSGTAPRVLSIRNRFCGDAMTVQINGPVTEVFIPARGPSVEATNAFRVRQSPTVHRTYAFYLDNELADSLHFVDQCPVTCLFSGHIQTVPLYSSFTLGVDDPFHPFELDHGETAQQFTMKYFAASCGTTVWHPNCATTIGITSGAELGTFLGPDGSDLGDEFTGTAEQIKQVRFSANGAQPEGETGEAVVVVSSRGITSTVTFTVRRTVPPISHFSLVADPDTIGHGSVAGIFVAARNRSGEEIVIAPETPLDLFLGVESGQYGDLAATIHGTPVKGDQLIGVRYDQARVGGVIYIADGENSIGKNPQQVPIGVQLQGQPEVSGFGTVTVGCRVDPPRYAQGDARWGNEHYDNAYAIKNGDTTTVGIRTLGCALSCMAMAMTAFGDTVTPGELNEFKKDTMNVGEARFAGKNVRWTAISEFSSRRVGVSGAVNVRDSTELEAIKGYLEKCSLVIAKVFNPESVRHMPQHLREKKEREGNHWVVLVRQIGTEIMIIDPGRGSSNLSEYGRIYRYVVVQKNNGGVI